MPEVALTEVDVLGSEEHKLVPRLVDPQRVHLPCNSTIGLCEDEVPLGLSKQQCCVFVGVGGSILDELFDDVGRLKMQRSQLRGGQPLALADVSVTMLCDHGPDEHELS